MIYFPKHTADLKNRLSARFVPYSPCDASLCLENEQQNGCLKHGYECVVCRNQKGKASTGVHLPQYCDVHTGGYGKTFQGPDVIVTIKRVTGKTHALLAQLN